MTAEGSRRTLVAELVSNKEPIAARIVERARAEIPGYTKVDHSDITPTTIGLLDGLLPALSERRDPTEAELESYWNYGTVRARQGISLVEVLRAWRLAVRMILDELAVVGAREHIPDRVLLDLTNDLLDIVDQAILQFTGGHREVEIEFARQDQQQRADFIRGLLLGLLGPADLRVEATRYGLDIDREYVPIRARPTAGTPLHELERIIGGPASHTVTATLDGDLAGITDHPPDAGPDTVIGCGRPARLDQIQPAFAAASRALTTAAAFDLTGTYDLSTLGLLPAVLADTELGDELVRRYLTPLQDGSAKTIIDTVRCYLDKGHRIDAVAEELFVHPNTVRYRIARYEDLTGTNLRRTRDTFEIWWALQRVALTTAQPTNSLGLDHGD